MGRNAVLKKRNTNPKKRDLYILKLMETFKKHGLKKFSMDSIEEKIKVSKATLTTAITNQPATVSAIRCIGALERCAWATI